MKIIIFLLITMNLFSNCKLIDKKYYKVQVCESDGLYLPTIGKTTTYSNHIDKLNIEKRPSFYNAEYNYYKKYKFIRPNHLGHTFATDSDFDYSDDSLKSTYDMVNVTPMHGKLNIGLWRKIENRGKELTKEYGELDHYTFVNWGESKYNFNFYPISYIRIYKNKNFEECYLVHNKINEDKDIKKYKIHCSQIPIESIIEIFK